MSTFGYVVLAPSSNAVFQNAKKNDLLLYSGSQQTIYVGPSNATNYFRVSSNIVQVIGDLDFSGSLTQNGTPFVSGSGDGGGTLGISGSNLALSGGISCGSLNISANVVGNAGGGSSGGSGSNGGSSSGNATSLTLYNNSTTSSAITSNVDSTGITVSLASSNAYMNVVAWNTAGTSNTELLRISGTGALGLKTTEPLYDLDVNGTVRASTIQYTSLQQSSDRRIKQNITPFDPILAKSIISQLQVVSYELISDPTNKKIGLIAQQVQEICPEAVRSGPGFMPFAGDCTISNNALATTADIQIGDMLKINSGAVITIRSSNAEGFQFVSSTIIPSEDYTFTDKLTSDILSVDWNVISALQLCAASST
jgi:hypothetical protein